MRPDIDPTFAIATLIILFLGIGIHEYAHCKLADAAGDPTPRYYGRVTLNLFKHFDPLGAMMIVLTTFSGFGIGWGKPSPMDSRKMRNPRWDFFAAVAAGPISNLLQAVVFAGLIRILGPQQLIGMPNKFLPALLFMGVMINIRLMLFNLIPLGPLDGHWLVGQLLPEKQRYLWYVFNRKTGTLLLFALIFGSQLTGFPVLGLLLGKPADAIESFLIGI